MRPKADSTLASGTPYARGLSMHGAFETLKGLYPGKKVAVRTLHLNHQALLWNGKRFEVLAEAPTWNDLIGVVLSKRPGAGA